MQVTWPGIAGTAGAGDMTGNIIAGTAGAGDMTGNIIAGTAAIRPDIDGILQGISLAGAASLGALLVSLLVIYISRKVKGTDTLLIFGVMTGFAVNAYIKRFNISRFSAYAHIYSCCHFLTSFLLINQIDISIC